MCIEIQIRVKFALANLLVLQVYKYKGVNQLTFEIIHEYRLMFLVIDLSLERLLSSFSRDKFGHPNYFLAYKIFSDKDLQI